MIWPVLSNGSLLRGDRRPENPPKRSLTTKMPCPKIFLPLYTAWLQGRVTKCACWTSEDDDDCEFVCLHHGAEEGACFCEEGVACQLCVYRQIDDLLEKVHDELSTEEKNSLWGRAPEEIFQDAAFKTPTKLSTVVACMTALLVKREEMTLAGPGEVEVEKEDLVAKAIMDEVVALLWLPMVRKRMPCELKGCNCVFNPIGRLIAPFAGLDADSFVAMAEEEQKGSGCRGLNADDDEHEDEE